MEKNSNKEFETTTLSAEVAISKTETGMDYVQVMPDNPRVGLFKPFCGWGRGQLLSNGSFDFLGNDGYDHVTILVPSILRADLPKILRKAIAQVIKHLITKGFSK